jgi:hypothetical protein
LQRLEDVRVVGFFISGWIEPPLRRVDHAVERDGLGHNQLHGSSNLRQSSLGPLGVEDLIGRKSQAIASLAVGSLT